ncbi:TonB-dependent receptor, partial [bacterium]|nr:TonB-dependent receptor [bacterium]
ENALELYAPKTTDFYAAHFLDKITLSDKWLLYLGGRIEDHDITGFNASPMASLVYHPTDNDVWRLSYSTAHRSPSFFESYANIHAPELPGRHFDGNQDARPEYIQSVDLGYQAFRFSNRLQLMFDLFAYRIERHIDLNDRIEPENGDYLENFIDNLGNTDGYGFELGVMSNPTTSTRLWGSYSFQNVSFQEDGIGLASPAQHKLTLGGGFDFAKHFSFDTWMYLQTDSEFIEETSDLGGRNDIYIDNYSLLNVRLSYRLPEKNLEFDFRGLNLIDDGHHEFPGEPIGRQFLLGVTYRF